MKSILIVGVGGQGTLLTSRVIGNKALSEGLDVKLSEVHGMSQRGGSVVTYVKIDKKVSSPVIDKKEADIILAFEELEAIRYIDYLKDDGIIIINTQQIDPMPVIIGTEKYPENIIEKIRSKIKNVVILDALEIAKECGNIKAVNMVMTGAMAAILKEEKEGYIKTIEKVIKKNFIELNKMAFSKGYDKIKLPNTE
jgi:indolepyruvate ferredoxin oxidoreductase beta subunit